MLTLGDGLGKMDMAKNLARMLAPEQAFFVGAVVHAAVRETRRAQIIGEVQGVEDAVGTAIQDANRRCLVRFFVILSGLV